MDWSSVAQWLAFLILDPAAHIPVFLKFFQRGKIIDVAEVNQPRWLEKMDSGLKMLIKTI